jgi:hypothetical protein
MEFLTPEVAPHILGRVTQKVIGMLSHESKEHRPDTSESLAAPQLSVLTGVI